MSVCSENVLLATCKVGMDLPRKERVFRDVGETGISVTREQYYPGNPSNDAEEGEVWRKLEDSTVTSKLLQGAGFISAC